MTDTDHPTSPPTGARSCQSWASGHGLHWIPGLRSAEDGRSPAVLVGVDDDGWLLVRLAEEPAGPDETIGLWHHDPDRVRAAAPLVGAEVAVSLRWGVLVLPSDVSGSRFVSVARDATPCVFDEPRGDLVDQLETHHGFTVAGADALAALDRHRHHHDHHDDQPEEEP